MNTTSRTLLETVVTTDQSLTALERSAVQKLLRGDIESMERGTLDPHAPLLLTQKAAAELLSVSRITIWRMAKDRVLHPVEVLPGSWRYPYPEIVAIARGEAHQSPRAQFHRPAA